MPTAPLEWGDVPETCPEELQSSQASTVAQAVDIAISHMEAGPASDTGSHRSTKRVKFCEDFMHGAFRLPSRRGTPGV